MSRRLQLLGFGNALVDIEFTVSDEELNRTGLHKSGMTLANTGEQHRLLNALLRSHRGRLSSGGSAANTIAAFAQFGGTAGYISALGVDEYGNFFADEFERLGIRLFAERIAGEPTGTCIVLITPDGERTMQTCLGASDCYERSMMDVRWFDYTEWLYVEGYKLTSLQGAEAAAEAVYLARKRGVMVALSFSDSFVVTTCRDVLTQLLPSVDLVFCNDREARAFVEIDNIDEAFAILSARVPHLIFTLGPNGSLVHVGGRTVHIPAYPTTVVDTNGAGDMYAGAFLYGLLHGWGIERAGHAASRAAARIVAQYGARYHGDHRELIGGNIADNLQRSSGAESVAGFSTDPYDTSSSPS